MVFLGTGTERLHRDEARRLVREVLAPHVRHWSVRSRADQDRLTSYGVAADRVNVTADLGWLLEPVPSDFGQSYLQRLGIDKDERLLGVNVTNERFVIEADPELPSSLDGEAFDRAAGARVLALMSRRDRATEVPATYRTPQEMMSLIAPCAVALSMRYRFCLFSALQGVPFIATNRSDKVEDLGRDLAWPHACPLIGVRATLLADMFAEIFRTSEALRGKLQEESARMRKRALTNDVVLGRLLAE